MKKVLVVGLAMLMVLMCAACGGESSDSSQSGEELTAIPLGGNLGDLPTDGNASMGKYVEVEAAEFFTDDIGDSECHVYYSENSDTPYIATYRWAGTGKTLEETANEISESFKMSEPQNGESTLSDGSKKQFCYFTGFGDYDGELGEGYFYVIAMLVQDGDDFVEIDFYEASDEIRLGDSDKYIWIPKGITDVLSDEEKEHDTLFMGKYSEDYGYPDIWISKNNLNYADCEWTWIELYPDGLPFTASQFEEWDKTGWSAEANQEFYDALGATNLKTLSDDICGCTVNRNYAQIEDNHFTDIYVYLLDGDEYNIWLASYNAPYYQFGEGVAYSLHTK